ncbi:MAG: ComF family protein [Kiritimatiellia bacterium]|jgi:ComF family protein|nr:ComF family protein [Lentisphaerota bacterium]
MAFPLLDMCYSRICGGCGDAMREDEPGAICWGCREKVQVVQVPFCEQCGDPVAGNISGEYVCAWCLKTRPAFDWARSAVRYAGRARGILRRFKYKGGVWLMEDLSQWLLAAWRMGPAGAGRGDVIVPVPLYPKRERERGFNQAGLLAEELSRGMGLPVLTRGMRRVRATATQTRLTAAQRVHNVRGVFAVSAPDRVRGARVVLVDDVMTTGATVNECARVLKAAGAAAVMVVTVARG